MSINWYGVHQCTVYKGRELTLDMEIQLKLRRKFFRRLFGMSKIELGGRKNLKRLM
jgi:hypothetical protein